MKASEIRYLFLNYFKNNQHEVLESASLIPKNDPSLLFVNAGMVPLKDVFLGNEHREYLSCASSQRCLRVGGKHNDFSQVGFTARHHTFFEMLGNFSFGAYFKKEAIQFAWNFLTIELRIPKNKLWISVYRNDLETLALWRDVIGIDESRISLCGEEDNFWSMGDVGPCGPCTEIFYDHGEFLDGGPPGSESQDGPRYMEIWNIVFMQYEKHANGNLTELKTPCVDTGMGLERIAAVMQGVTDTYEIDIFKNIMQVIDADVKLPLHVRKILADHMRSGIMLIAEGLRPGAVGRSYVLRRLIRRALRYAYQAGLQPCISQWSDAICDLLSESFSVIADVSEHIKNVLKQEEDQFLHTLERGILLLNEYLKDVSGTVVDGKIAFKLYDTYGFPIDVTQDILSEKNLTLDFESFNLEMEKQKKLSQADSVFRDAISQHVERVENEFIGYDKLECKAKVLACYEYVDDALIKVEKTNGDAASTYVVLDKTVFYPEGGGQVGDRGRLDSEDFIAEVCDTLMFGDVIMHRIKILSASVYEGMIVNASVDSRRYNTCHHHTATHLLHAALRVVIGLEVEQRGSYVDSERLRFDFSCSVVLTDDILIAIEDWVNNCIYLNIPLSTAIMNVKDALNQGAIGIFESSYKNDVRVVSIDGFSKELCGGTHAKSTGELGGFMILSTTTVSSGIKRIEAVVGQALTKKAIHMRRDQQSLLKMFSCAEDLLVSRAHDMIESCKIYKRQVQELRLLQCMSVLEKKIMTKEHEVLVLQFDLEQSDLLKLADYGKKQIKSWLILLGYDCRTLVCVGDYSLEKTEDLLSKLRNFLPLKAGCKAGLIRGSFAESVRLKELSDLF